MMLPSSALLATTGMIDAPTGPRYNARHSIIGVVVGVGNGQIRVRRLIHLVFILCLISSSLINQPYQTHAADDVAPVPLGLMPFGVNTHLATRYTDLASIDTPADLVAKAGAGWAREDIHWYRIQPSPDTWDWEFTDAAIRALVTRGIKVVGVIGHPPGWATPDPYDSPGSFSFSAPDTERFAAFAQARLFRTAGMRSARAVDRLGLRLPKQVVGYKGDGDEGFEESSAPSSITGDGNVFASLADMIAWLRALDGTLIFTPAQKRIAWTNGRLDSGRAIASDGSGYGYGWSIEPDNVVSHSGSWFGASTYVLRHLTDGVSVIVLSNDEDAEASEIAEALAELVK